MSATEKLRELLDERGVEWSDGTFEGGVPNNHRTFWGEGGRYAAAEDCEGNLHIRFYVTPEQAIEATLGAAKEPPTAVKVILPSEWNACEPIPWVDVTMPNGDVTHLVPEATFGRGECRNVEEVKNIWFRCSECGCDYELVVCGEPISDMLPDGPRFCPNCGRRCVG